MIKFKRGPQENYNPKYPFSLTTGTFIMLMILSVCGMIYLVQL